MNEQPNEDDPFELLRRTDDELGHIIAVSAKQLLFGCDERRRLHQHMVDSAIAVLAQRGAE